MRFSVFCGVGAALATGASAGISRGPGGRQLPAYIPHVGGNYEGGNVVMGKRLKSRIPAKRVPDASPPWASHRPAVRPTAQQQASHDA